MFILQSIKNTITGQNRRDMPKIQFFSKNQSVFFILWFLLCSLVHFVVLKRFGFSNRTAIFDAALSNGILLVLTFILEKIQRSFHSSHPVNFVNVGIVLGLSTIYTCSVSYIAELFFSHDVLYVHLLEQHQLIRTIIGFLVLFLALYQFWLTKNYISRQKEMNQKLEIERQLNKAELANIEQQLQPHFLFNSLNSISALTVVQPDEARRMVHLLSDFLRGTLRKDHEQYVDLKEELDHLNLYLEIEKVRFGHRLDVRLELDSSCEGAKIPALILQPIVENSIKYGLYGQTGGLTIGIQAACSNNFLSLSVSNPYEKDTVSASRGIGFGLSSIERKLYLLYARNDLLKIEKTDTLFTITLKIPQQEKPAEK